MKHKISILKAGIFCLLVAILTFFVTCGITTGSWNLSELPEKYNTFQKIQEIDHYVQQNYLLPIDEEAVKDGMATGYLLGLDDPYAAYYTGDEFQKMLESNEGSMVGIGVSIRAASDDTVEVLRVYPNSPAEGAGLQPGDHIIAVDGQDVTLIGYNQATRLLQGELGSTVTLTISRDSTIMDLSLTRQEFEIPSVFYQMDGDNGYIRIISFAQTTVAQFEEAVNTLISNGAKGFIFDLRDNSGGTLDSVCAMLDFLLPEGILATQTLSDGTVEVLATSQADEISLPMVVLTNEGTASAAELFTCDLKDYQKAVQVGETTYGKGVMQTTHLLQDGSAIKLTTAYYNPAKSDNYDGVGLVPDYEVVMDSSQETAYLNGTLSLADDPQYQQAVSVLMLQE